MQQVTGDLNKPESMRAALTGVRAMFLYPGYQDMAGTLAEARQAGVRHVVLLSGSSAASGDMSNAVSRYMIESETAVRQSGLAWTMVRSFGFMSNTGPIELSRTWCRLAGGRRRSWAAWSPAVVR